MPTPIVSLLLEGANMFPFFCILITVLIALYIWKYTNYSKAKADISSVKDSLVDAKDAFVASRAAKAADKTK